MAIRKKNREIVLCQISTDRDRNIPTMELVMNDDPQECLWWTEAHERGEKLPSVTEESQIPSLSESPPFNHENHPIPFNHVGPLALDLMAQRRSINAISTKVFTKKREEAEREKNP